MKLRFAFIAAILALPRVFGAEVALAPPFANRVEVSRLPLAFEKNQGQAPPAADFLARGAGYSVTLSQGNAHISLRRNKNSAPAVLDLRVVGARPNPKKSGQSPLPGKVNYFIGNQPSRWRTDISTYGRVDYSNVYGGIDLAYYGDQGRLEYDFIVAPGADPSVIRLAAGGARCVRLNAAGDLVFETGGGEVTLRKPVSYQEIAGARRTVESSYSVNGSNDVRFAIGAYDPRYPLLIDPALVYSTYLGGSGEEIASAVAVSPAGNAFVTGYTYSTDFPLVDAEQSTYGGDGAIFVSKFAVDGASLVYSTYFGGSNLDASHAIAVDGSGDVYIVGDTTSADFPTKNPLYPNYPIGGAGFVTKFNSAGNALVYSTFLGGSQPFGVAVDAAHNVYVAGNTGAGFPVTSGAYQTTCTVNTMCTFATKINAAGSALVWSTYFGESTGGNYYPYVTALAIDASGNAYLTGWTYTALPVTPGVPQSVYGGNGDAFIAKIANTGATLAYCTYLGGSEWDAGYGIAVDSAGNAYIAGNTESADFPATPGAFQTKFGGYSDAFIAKLNSAGTEWQYVTYLGGQKYEEATAIAVDSGGDAVVAGYTFSGNFPRASAVQRALQGNQVTIFKTTSAGVSWSESDSGVADEIISAIVIDPVTDSHVFALTIAGLFESINSGASWSADSIFGPGSGATPSFLAFSPTGGNAYAAVDSTLLFISHDRGTTWNQSYPLPCYATTALVDPSSLYVYIGGAFPGNSCSSGLNINGQPWLTLDIPSPNGVYGYAITPGAPGILYAATGNGIFESTDSQRYTWTAVSFQGQVVTQVVVDPSQPATLYAVVSGVVFKSTNAGSTWVTSSAGLPASVKALALAPSKSSVIYASTSAGMFLSKDSAASWSSIGLTQNQITAIAVDPGLPNKLYAAATTYTDAFVTKINPQGSKLLYSTFLGGTYSDNAVGVALDSGGNAFVLGSTTSPDFPTTPGAFQSANGVQRYTAFVTKIEQKTPSCSYGVAPATLFVYPGGGAENFSVTSPAGCPWTPSPTESWITVPSGKEAGVGPLAVSVAANTGAARTGTITIGNASIAITQAAAGCAYSLSNNSLTFPQTGGQLSIDVSTGAGCQWIVTGLPFWITASSGLNGNGNGTVVLETGPNTFLSARTGFYLVPVTIANNVVAINQPGTLPVLAHQRR